MHNVAGDSARPRPTRYDARDCGAESAILASSPTRTVQEVGRSSFLREHSMIERQVRAAFSDRTITVYQAYSRLIADKALMAGTFVAPFRSDRMTWIKPSFLWMMYRSGWATKPDQERILAVSIVRSGFEWALANSCLTRHEPGASESALVWAERKRSLPVRVQWDPDRSLTLQPLQRRAIQVGLSKNAVQHYVEDWITEIVDVTPLAHELRDLVARDRLETAQALLPTERRYKLPGHLRHRIGAE